MNRTIRLIVADVDGCVTHGSHFPFDLSVLALISGHNARSREDPLVPALTFCTGRPLPYVQALQQACHCRHPAIAEFGAVMWDPVAHLHSVHPAYAAGDRERYLQLHADAEREFGTAGEKGVLIEAGKLCQLTLYPRRPLTVADLAERVAPFTARWSAHFSTDHTTAVINYLPHAVNKGTAVEWLAATVGIPLGEMAGLGDSASDWPFMERCAVSAAPANAVPELRRRADWQLALGAAKCMEELYARVIAHNRSVAEAGAPGR